MSPIFKKVIALLSLMLTIESASAFSYYGPAEPWQTDTVNTISRWFYGDVVRASTPEFSFAFVTIGPPAVIFGGTADLGASKNLEDEFRLNVPTITYAYDSSFLNYFGANGVKAIDQAMSILNRLPRVSRASSDLFEFLTDDNQRINQRAQALNLIDLKSVVLNIMLERFGLLGETHIFDVHDRTAYPGTCNFNYTIVTRNYDLSIPNTQYSHYVNDTLYTYDIFDLCPVASVDAVERRVDPTSFQFTAVATQAGLAYGGYYLGITRDDMGGLRYLYRRDNFNPEPLPTNTIPRRSSSPWVPVDPIGVTNNVNTNTVAVRGGVEKIRFTKKRFDSLLGTGFKAIKFDYSLPYKPDFKVESQSITRVITRPDIIFAAADLTRGLFNPTYERSTPAFLTVSNNVVAVAGPGALDPQAVVTFNKVGPYTLNATPFFLDEITSTPGFRWGSFDGSTNPPVVYPQGSNIRDLERQVLTGQ